VLSLDQPALVRCHALDPDIRTAAVVVAVPGSGAPAAAGAIGALCLEAHLTGEREVAACRAAGLDCHALGVDDPATARRLAALGVAGLVTGRVDLLTAAFAGAAPPSPPFTRSP
jgi:glycerophosphoryl diester phosphodiesterase